MSGQELFLPVFLSHKKLLRIPMRQNAPRDVIIVSKGGVEMRYRVKRIMEPDYGCEERPENYVDMDKVILCDENGSELCIEVADEELYEKEINVGDLVTLDPGNEIRKAEIHEENIEKCGGAFS